MTKSLVMLLGTVLNTLSLTKGDWAESRRRGIKRGKRTCCVVKSTSGISPFHGRGTRRQRERCKLDAGESEKGV